MLGNRGVLHDDRRAIVRQSQVRRWICCVLEWKEIRRTIMKPRSYTELFFLDEATAFAAGHRPCFECRRAAALRYQACWPGVTGAAPLADAMDRVLEAERRLPGGGKKTHAADVSSLPDGAFLRTGQDAWLLHGGRRWRWTFEGYAESRDRGAGTVDVLTPAATVAVLRAGYRVSVHPSAAPP